MTEIQLTNVQFAQLQLDNLMAKDKPYIETWSAGDVGSFNAILNAVDFDNEFTYHMRGWSRQRVISGTGGYRDWETDRKSTRLNSSHSAKSRMPSSA